MGMTPADTTLGRRGRTAAGALSGMRSAGVALDFVEAVVAFVDAKAASVVVVDGGLIDATAQRLRKFEIAQFGTSDKLALVDSIVVVWRVLPEAAAARGCSDGTPLARTRPAGHGQCTRAGPSDPHRQPRRDAGRR